MLHGTPYKDDEKYVDEHGYMTKWRVVPLDFSIIDEQYIFDVEAVAVATNTLSFDEYVEARKYLLVIDLCFNSEVFDPVKKYLRTRGIKTSDWIQSVYRQIESFPAAPREVFASFEKETKSELWEDEAQLVNFYSQPENYQKLINYEEGGNVLFKHRVWMLSKVSQAWIAAVFRCTEKLIFDQSLPAEVAAIKRELTALENFILSATVDCFSPQTLEEPIETEFDFDVPAWLDRDNEMLSDFAVATPLSLNFRFTPKAVAVMRDAFRRYGTDIAGLTKMVQRTAGVSYTRKVDYLADPRGLEANHRIERIAFGPGQTSM
jgi:hypothetical protein